MQEESIRIGKAGKAVESLTMGQVGRDTVVRITRSMLDRIAMDNPQTYLAKIERMCDAFRNVSSVRTVGLRFEVLGVSSIGGGVTVVCIGVAYDGTVLYANEKSVDCDGSGWMPAKRLARK